MLTPTIQLYEVHANWAAHYYVDLCYSSDDGGWYAQRHADDAVTDIWHSQNGLKRALENGECDWAL